jgi:N-glycosylase/DNA lyase
MSFFDKISGVFGGGIVKTIDEIVDKYVTTAEEKALIKQKVTEETNRAVEAATKLQLEEASVYITDAQNARAMQIAALAQDDKFSKRFVYFLAGFLIVASFGYIYMVTFRPIPVENKEIANTVLGLLIGAVFGSVLQYFFGSTKSSNEKTKAIAALALKVDPANSKEEI